MSKSSLNFAPYAPPPDAPRTSSFSGSNANSTYAPVPSSEGGYHAGAPVSSLGSANQTSFSSSGAAGHSRELGSEFDGSGWSTSRGWRHDIMAAAAYALGPIGAIALLILETNNDFVRFHAWQSAFLSVCLLIVHLVSYAILWRWIQYVLFAADILLLGSMALRAYRDSDLLDRYHLPYIGPIADKWVAEE